MAFTQCPSCGKESQHPALLCPYCGYPLFYYVVVIGLLAFGTFIYLNLREPPETVNSQFAEWDKYLEEYVEPPFEDIPYFIMQTGAEYHSDLVNPLGKLENYLAEPEKAAIMLGVYMADVEYVALYDKTQETMEYFLACQQLADRVGVTAGFGSPTGRTGVPEIQNWDSLSFLLDRAMEQVINCKVTPDSSSCALVLTSTFLEGLYLSTSIIDTYPGSAPHRIQILTPLISLVLGQASAIPVLLSELEKADQTTRVKSLIKGLQSLQNEYALLEGLREKIIKGGSASSLDK